MIALGIDTGANTAWAIVDVPVRQVERPKVIARGMFDRERRAAQLGILLGTRNGGTMVATELLRIRWELPSVITQVGIEAVNQVYSRDRFGAAMATHIARGERVVGALENECEHAGIEAIIATAAQVRQKLTGKAQPSNQQIAAWVRLWVECDVSTNEHTRDAILAAIYAARHAMVQGGRSGDLR